MKQCASILARVERKEKKGRYGGKRQKICKDYLASLSRIQSKADQMFAEAATVQSKEPGCRPGCAYCCYHYVTVSAVHGMVIVDYLYQNKSILAQFIHNYEEWRAAAANLVDTLDRKRNSALQASEQVTSIIASTRSLSESYFLNQIACPFLLDNQCSIYPVRPLSCSGHYSLSPSEQCSPEASSKPDIFKVIPEDEDLTHMLSFVDAEFLLFELALPTMVHRLLFKGSKYVMNNERLAVTKD